MGMVVFVSDIVIPRYFDKYHGLASGISSAGSGVGLIVWPIIEQKAGVDLHWR